MKKLTLDNAVLGKTVITRYGRNMLKGKIIYISDEIDEPFPIVVKGIYNEQANLFQVDKNGIHYEDAQAFLEVALDKFREPIEAIVEKYCHRKLLCDYREDTENLLPELQDFIQELKEVEKEIELCIEAGV